MSEHPSGSCQCGAVRYQITGKPIVLAVCHCTDCQQQSGSAFGMTLMLAKDDLTTTGQLQTWTKTSDSGKKIDCHFCPVCGNRIYHETVEPPDGVVRVKPGTLDNPNLYTPQVHVWTNSKQAWVTVPADAQQFDEQP